MLFRKRRQQASSLDQRAREAREEDAESKRRLHAIRQNVVRPLAETGSRNQFADIIRASLIQGRGGN
jgi:hypothetical protein